MSDARGVSRARSRSDRCRPRLLGIFKPWRLRAYGFSIAIIYAVVLVHFYRVGGWVVDKAGVPLYTDFTTCWVVGLEALNGEAALLYNSAKFLEVQTTLLGPRSFLYPNWPYPPSFSLFLAPFALLPYFWAFITWNFATLLACIVVVYMIVRRSAAIALVLASPFTVWNFLAGQNGFLTASLVGAALLSLERRPRLAGVFIGLLTYKPQFGILFPVALIAARQWTAIWSAVTTFALLAGASLLAFGVSAWEAFPGGLLQQSDLVLLAGGQPDAADWGRVQTFYGLIRLLHGDAVQACIAQSILALCLTIVIWLIWRSPVPHALKAVTLSAAALVATPYAFSYDLAALAIPFAFLARDQLCRGLLRGEQTLMLASFGIALAALVVFADSPHRMTFGSVPLGPFVSIVVLGITICRAFRYTGKVPVTPILL